MEEKQVKQIIVNALFQIGAICSGNHEDSRRWSAGDLATDLAPLITKEINKRQTSTMAETKKTRTFISLTFNIKEYHEDENTLERDIRFESNSAGQNFSKYKKAFTHQEWSAFNKILEGLKEMEDAQGEEP